MNALTIDVAGVPAPQGSKRGFVNRHTGRVVLVEQSAKVKPWRQDVKAACLDARGDRPSITGPVELTATFYMPRPKAHYGTGKNADRLKPNAPTYVDKKPDQDKLLRSTLDGIGEAGVWGDDAQVAVIVAGKLYGPNPATGAHGARISIVPLAAQMVDVSDEQEALL